ncbi:MULTISPECIES: DUF4153 domain-containing protein [unclassified Nocardia]|uniref:DUF4153 domain-containing protein n=1 Tax=unclassified Nocardia TaxID=2637762 RepID=UPI0033A344F7
MTDESATPRTPDQLMAGATATKTEPAAGATATKTEPAPGPGASAPPKGDPPPWTEGWQAAAVMPPMPKAPALPPPPLPVYRRRFHVTRPAGVLPAAAVAGIVGATVIPLDRPGLGWVLAGGVIAGALGIVDHRARTRTSTAPSPAPDTATPNDSAAAPARTAAPDTAPNSPASMANSPSNPAPANADTTPAVSESSPAAPAQSGPPDPANGESAPTATGTPAPGDTSAAPTATGRSAIETTPGVPTSGRTGTPPTPADATPAPDTTSPQTVPDRSATAAKTIEPGSGTSADKPAATPEGAAVATAETPGPAQPGLPAPANGESAPTATGTPAPGDQSAAPAAPGRSATEAIPGVPTSGRTGTQATPADLEPAGTTPIPTGHPEASGATPTATDHPELSDATPTATDHSDPSDATPTANVDSAVAAGQAAGEPSSSAPTSPSTSSSEPVDATKPSAGPPEAPRAAPIAATVAPAGSSSAFEPVIARHRLWWTAAALVLLGVGTFRAAGWLFVLCVLAAGVAGSLAVLGRRTGRGIAHDMVAVPLASFEAVPWAFSGLRDTRPAELSNLRRYGASVAVTAALLVVFVPLLGGADATFAELLSGLVPSIDAATAWQWIVLFAVIGMGALGGLYLLAGPLAAGTETRPIRLWSRSEWVLPVGALTVLFAAFLGAQFVALFGGDDYVQRTAGLTYAEYARSGFWQLSAVSILTLAVILAVLHWASQETAADRRWLRILLSAVSVLALVIVGSALARMWTYQQAYGFTVLRLLVEVCELWVGLVYVLVLVAIARLRWRWVPRAAVGTALATLIALAVLDPEQFVAERNIARWEDGKRLDSEYLSTLSPDILPALTELPAGLRADIEDPIRADLDDDHWWSWNLSRSSAR